VPNQFQARTSVPQFVTASVAALLVLSTAAQSQSAGATQARAAGSIAILADGKELVLSPSEIAKLERREARVVAEGASEAATVSGVRLWDLIQRAGVPSAQASGRQRAVMYVKLTGADGQSAVLALVEVDPGFSQRTVLVIDRRDGKPLDSVEGPWRVIIPDDGRHARWIRGLVTIEVVTLK
jgi:hypothetical protein